MEYEGVKPPKGYLDLDDLKKLRSMKKVSIRKAATALNISKTAYTAYENRTCNPTLFRYFDIVEYYKQEIAEFKKR